MILHDHSDRAVHFLQIHLGGDRNFCYLIGDKVTGEAAAVDPAFAPDRMADIAQERGIRVRYILITHGHSDHTAGAGALALATGATIHAGREDRVPGAKPVQEADAFALGRHKVLAIHTPGHTRGHMCYLFEGRLLTGDLLFCGKVGGTGPEFTGSSARQEWESLAKLMTLPDDTLVFPGHDFWGGAGERPHSTIGYEREHNPFLLCADFATFETLKESWPAYKKEHGIR